jgi:hypothetical protein
MSGDREVTRTGGCSVAMGGRRTEMKNTVRVAVVIALVLAALSGCELYQAINVTWTIDNIVALGGGTTRIYYSVQNLGKIDLTGVNLEIGADMAGTGLYYPYSIWTPDFSLNKNQIKSGWVDLYTGLGGPPLAAAVLSIDMDNPSG